MLLVFWLGLYIIKTFKAHVLKQQSLYIYTYIYIIISKTISIGNLNYIYIHTPHEYMYVCISCQNYIIHINHVNQNTFQLLYLNIIIPEELPKPKSYYYF